MASSKKSSWNLLLIPLIISVIFIVLAFTPFFQSLDRGVYDGYLHLKPPIGKSPEIVLLDVDDNAIDKLGAWPWPRNFMADGLVTLREFKARYAVFDIEYINKSPPGIDRFYLENGLKREFDQKFGDLGSNINDLFSAIATRNISLHDAPSFVNDLYNSTKETGEDLYNKAKKVALNNDLYLGQAVGFFGGSYVTLNRQAEKQDTISDKLREIAATRFSYPFQGSENRKPPYTDFLIPLEDIVSRAKGAGLTNVEIDSDGKRRRIRLFENVAGKYYGQLVFSPLMDYLGHPKVTISSSNVHLEGAKYPDGSTRNVDIPLDDQGMMLINWLPEDYQHSFYHVSFYSMVDYRIRENRLLDILSQLAARDAWKAFSGENAALKMIQEFQALEETKGKAIESGKEEDIQEFLKQKEAWLAELQNLGKSSTEAELLGALTASKGDKSLIEAEKNQTSILFGNVSKELSNLLEARKELTSHLNGALCIIGYTGTGTSDIGVNPFQKDYVNVGTHASVANTILQQKFLQESPIWISLFLTLLLSVGLVYFLRDLSPLRQNLAGAGFVVLLFVIGLVLFLSTGVYFQILGPLLSVFFSFVVYSLVRFFSSEQEKSFLRKAFSTYLSGDVINEIVTDPGKLKLGGDEKRMTAIFTDVKGFSTISEQLTAPALVHLLNDYLSGMSDLILNEKGTIDKYEGDAIIAFFGAPLDLEDHAARACISAIRMKQLEDTLNQKFIEEKMSPVPLLTRIGINTGEMVVGNMGTERKMNYTIMGNSVNLAARLEGVNKQYGTWILTTDYTKQEAGDQFLTRRLDRVRVVGINTPVQLHEVLGLKSEMEESLIKLVDLFHEGLDLFEKREWAKANKIFEKVVKQRPDDGPGKTYSKRCSDFLVKPPQNWDGVFNLTEK